MAGLLAWVLLGCGVPLLAAHLVAGYDDPAVFALTHLTVLGWVTMTVIGATYQLFPVALQGTLAWPRVAKLDFYVYGAGVAGFVPSFFFVWTPGVAAFGSLTVLGVVVYAANVLRSYSSIGSRHVMAPYLLAGLGWLLVTLGFGLAWALDWQFNWFAITPNLLAAHVQAGMAGWLGSTLMGVSYKLMELFALAHRRSWRVARFNLALWNLCLAALVLSLLLAPGTWAVPAAALGLALSALTFGADLARMWWGRRRRAVSLEQGYLALSLGSLLLTLALGVSIAWGLPLGPNWEVAYGYAAFVGCFGFAVIGKYFKIIPFLVWMHHYSGPASAGHAPMLRDLVDERRGWLALVLLGLGFAGVLGGILSGLTGLVVAAGLAYLLGALVNTATLGLALLPERGPLRSPRASGALPGGG